MGCASTKGPGNNFNGEVSYKAHLAEGNNHGPKSITVDEVIIIKKTWNYLAKDMEGNGLQIFLRIFEICPTVKTLFFVNDVRHSEIARNTIIKAHGLRFMNAINAVVENLGDIDDDESKLSKLLVLLGQQHKKHPGFKADYFECFYEALMWRWELCIGEKFKSEVSEAWSHLFIYIMEKLLQGYNAAD